MDFTINQPVTAEDIIGDDPTSVKVGYAVHSDGGGCIAIGNNARTPDGRTMSVVVCTGENDFIDPESNINFAHVMEANSETKDVIFPKSVKSYDGFFYRDQLGISDIEACSACGEPSVGFQWDAGGYFASLCMNCIRDVSCHYRAKASWESKNGDPIEQLAHRCNDLQKQIDELTLLSKKV